MNTAGDSKGASIPPQPSSLITPIISHEWDNLSPYELVWARLQPWLVERGYKLRPRYQPGWKASWLAEGFSKSQIDCEDIQTYSHAEVMDAVRVRDGALVMLKRVKRTSDDGDELDMAKFLSQKSLDADDRNHCVAIYDILDIPGTTEEVLLVMPLLYEIRHRLEFETVGEVVDFFRQVIEGLQFMHQHNIAYRDCKEDNILADSGELYTEPPHPLLLNRSYDGSRTVKQRFSTTRRPVRYTYIDFGLSTRYSSRTGNTEPSPWSAGIYDIPEFRPPLNIPTDPFPVDIYMLGATIRRHYLVDLVVDDTVMISRRNNLEWMDGLVRDMMADDPKDRPKIEEVMDRFNALIKGLSKWKLRAPANEVEHKMSLAQKMRHWFIQASRTIRFIPAIPKCSPRRANVPAK